MFESSVSQGQISKNAEPCCCTISDASILRVETGSNVQFFRQENQIREKVGWVLQNWTAAIVNKVYVARGEQFLIGHHGNCECCWSPGKRKASFYFTQIHSHLHCSELDCIQLSSQIVNKNLFHKQCKE